MNVRAIAALFLFHLASHSFCFAAGDRPAPRISDAVGKLEKETQLSTQVEQIAAQLGTPGSFFSFHNFGREGVLVPIKDSSFRFKWENYDFDSALDSAGAISEPTFLSLLRRANQVRVAESYNGPKLRGLSLLSIGQRNYLGLRVDVVSGDTTLKDLQRYAEGPGDADLASRYVSFIESVARAGVLALDAHNGNFFVRNSVVVPFDVAFVRPAQLTPRSTNHLLTNLENQQFDNTVRTVQRAQSIFREDGNSRAVEKCAVLMRELGDLYRSR